MYFYCANKMAPGVSEGIMLDEHNCGFKFHHSRYSINFITIKFQLSKSADHSSNLGDRRSASWIAQISLKSLDIPEQPECK